MARKVFSSSRKCSGHGSVRSRTGFSATEGASEPGLEASEGAADGCLPTRASRVDVEEEAVTDRALRALACLLALEGGVTGRVVASLAARVGDAGGGMEIASDRGTEVAVAFALSFCCDVNAGFGGGDTIWNPSSSSSSDLISITSASFLIGVEPAKPRRLSVGDLSRGSFCSSSPSDLISSAACLPLPLPFVSSLTGRDAEDEI